MLFTLFPSKVRINYDSDRLFSSLKINAIISNLFVCFNLQVEKQNKLNKFCFVNSRIFTLCCRELFELELRVQGLRFSLLGHILVLISGSRRFSLGTHR